MDDLVTRLAAGVQQREVRWPGNDGSDLVTDRGGATATMAEAANRIVVLEKALAFYADPANYIDALWQNGTLELADTPNAIPAVNQEGAWVCDCGDVARAVLGAAS